MPDRIIPRDLLAAEARRIIERHDEWDSLHAFATLHWDGENLTIGAWAFIDGAVNPPDYPAFMTALAADEMKTDPPPVAYLLFAETFGMARPGPGASAEERRQFDEGRRNRTFHEQPGAVESATCWVADIYGRMWAASHARAHPDVISEKFYPPGTGPGGFLIKALRDIAAATGQQCHGMPGRTRR